MRYFLFTLALKGSSTTIILTIHYPTMPPSSHIRDKAASDHPPILADQLVIQSFQEFKNEEDYLAFTS